MMLRRMHDDDYAYIRKMWIEQFGNVVANKREKCFRHINDNPFSDIPYNYYVLEQENKVIGYVGEMPYKFHIFTHDYDGFIFVDNMTDASFRGKGVGTMIVKNALGQSTLFSLGVWMNAPNSRVAERAGLKPVNPIFTYIRGYDFSPLFKTKYAWLNKILTAAANRFFPILYKIEKLTFNSKNNNISFVDKFDDRIDTLFHDVKKHFNCIAFRTHKSLNWKFAHKESPKFQKLVYTRDKSLLGYLIFIVRNKNNRKVATIYDFLCSPDKKDIFCALMESAIIEIEKSQPDSIEILCSDKRYKNMLKRYGFLSTRENKYALKYMNDEYIKNSESLRNGYNWFFTYGDGDKVFWEF